MDSSLPTELRPALPARHSGEQAGRPAGPRLPAPESGRKRRRAAAAWSSRGRKAAETRMRKGARTRLGPRGRRAARRVRGGASGEGRGEGEARAPASAWAPSVSLAWPCEAGVGVGSLSVTWEAEKGASGGVRLLRVGARRVVSARPRARVEAQASLALLAAPPRWAARRSRSLPDSRASCPGAGGKSKKSKTNKQTKKKLFLERKQASPLSILAHLPKLRNQRWFNIAR